MGIASADLTARPDSCIASSTSVSVIAWLKSAEHDHLADIVPALRERFGRERLLLQLAAANPEDGLTDPFSVGCITAADLPDAKPAEPLWFGLYPGMVTLLIGATGAGKSSLLYNLAVHAAFGVELWGHAFRAGSPLRVLYIDPENAGNYAGDDVTGGLCAVKLERIGMGRPRNLVFHSGSDVNLSSPAHIAALERHVREGHFDVVVLEPIVDLFRTKDENDNAEAAAQMKALKSLSRATGAVILVVHHTGKENPGDAFGRGASARLASADVGMLFRARGGEEHDDTYTGEANDRTDVVRLQIVKDRVGVFGKGSLYLRMEGQDRFDCARFSDWTSAKPLTEGRPTKVDLAVEAIQALLADGQEWKRADIIRELREENIGQRAVDEGLDRLVTQGLITKRTGPHGVQLYQLRSFAQS